MAFNLDALEQEVARNTSVDQSAIALLTGLSERVQQLADEIAQQGIDASKVQLLADELKGSSDALAAAVAANTPAQS